jgi:ADP-heptose:LPS heptosyltransferase
MALPAMQAIAEVGNCTVSGPSWINRLTVDLADSSSGSHDVAVLFKSSFSAAWQARHVPKRVGLPTDMRGLLLTEAVVDPGGHRRDGYAALAQAVGAAVNSFPMFQPTDIERASAPDIGPDSVLLTPLSRSQETVGWTGFRALADHLGERAVFAAGPGECEALASIAGPHRTLPPLPIGEFAAVAQRASSVVANDSGLSHLAAAARRSAELDPATVHVVFGSTDPEHTGAAGCTDHRLAPLDCQPCYRKRCHINADQPPCLDVPMHRVAEALS